MNPQAVLTFTQTRPFVPFRVHVADITHYDVLRPDWMLVGGSLAVIGVREDPESPLFDEPAILPLRSITRLEPLATKAA